MTRQEKIIRGHTVSLLSSVFVCFSAYYLKCVYTKRKNSFKKLLNTDHQIENLIARKKPLIPKHTPNSLTIISFHNIKPHSSYSVCLENGGELKCNLITCVHKILLSTTTCRESLKELCFCVLVDSLTDIFLWRDVFDRRLLERT